MHYSKNDGFFKPYTCITLYFIVVLSILVTWKVLPLSKKGPFQRNIIFQVLSKGFKDLTLDTNEFVYERKYTFFKTCGRIPSQKAFAFAGRGNGLQGANIPKTKVANSTTLPLDVSVSNPPIHRTAITNE